MAEIQLPVQDLVPRVVAVPKTAGQGQEIGAAGDILVARLHTALATIFRNEVTVKTVPNASISFLQTSLCASTMTSRRDCHIWIKRILGSFWSPGWQ